MKFLNFLMMTGVVTGLAWLGRSLFFNSPQASPGYDEEDDLSIDEFSIRELAQQIWENEGKPEGQAQRHWEMATQLLRRSLADPHYHDAAHTGGDTSDYYAHTDKKSIH